MKMGKNKELEQRVDQIMGLPDRLESLEAGPDFYSGIRRKIASQENADISPIWNLFVNLKLQPALLSIIFVINIATALFLVLGSGAQNVSQNNYDVYASLLMEGSTLESNTSGENIYTNFLGEAE